MTALTTLGGWSAIAAILGTLIAGGAAPHDA